MTIMEIIDNLFGDWAQMSTGTGSLVPAWRWALLSNDADASVYRKRSITTQYRETDLAFIERLLAEEGLYYWFEHSAGADGVAGSLESAKHTLVIADDTAAFTDNAQARVRYHRANATESTDTIQQLVTACSLTTHGVEIASWDYRSLDTRSSTLSGEPDDAAADMPLTRFDAPGAYLWPDRETGERHATRQIEALEAQRQQLTGNGTVRSLAPGTCFVLDDHFDTAPLAPAARGAGEEGADNSAELTNKFAVLRVTHHARNNLAPTLGAGLASKALDLVGRKTKSGDKESKAQKEAPLYTNTFTLLPAALAYRPITQDDNGIVLRPRPSTDGAAMTQTDDRLIFGPKWFYCFQHGRRISRRLRSFSWHQPMHLT